jgi:hypothetical protein
LRKKFTEKVVANQEMVRDLVALARAKAEGRPVKDVLEEDAQDAKDFVDTSIDQDNGLKQEAFEAAEDAVFEAAKKIFGEDVAAGRGGTGKGRGGNGRGRGGAKRAVPRGKSIVDKPTGKKGNYRRKGAV